MNPLHGKRNSSGITMKNNSSVNETFCCFTWVVLSNVDDNDAIEKSILQFQYQKRRIWTAGTTLFKILNHLENEYEE